MKNNYEININANYTKILEVILFAFAYRLFHEDFSSVDGTNYNANMVKSLII